VGRGDDQGQPRRSSPAGRRGRAPRRAAGIARIICEVDRLDQIEPALAAGATTCCSTTWPATLREAVALVAGRVPTEASGGVRLDTIGAIAATGVDYRLGRPLTQSAPAADIGLDFTPL
jgi:nicotinate-nucleotide pyrophosphorylase (carboxylating)